MIGQAVGTIVILRMPPSRIPEVRKVVLSIIPEFDKTLSRVKNLPEAKGGIVLVSRCFGAIIGTCER